MYIDNTNYAGAVFNFMKRHKQYVGKGPHLPPLEVAQFRKRLIAEEVEELFEAMGINSNEYGMPKDNADLTLIADALADLLYVVFGTAFTYGLPIAAIFKEVHRSNMTKDVDTDAIVDGINWAGKVKKGSNFQSPKIKQIIEAYIRMSQDAQNPSKEPNLQV